VLNRGASNIETMIILLYHVDANTLTLFGGLANYHCYLSDDFTPSLDAGFVQETVEDTLPHIVFADPTVYSYNTVSTTISLRQLPSFLYDSTDPEIPANADNLQDGGHDPDGEAHSPQDGQFPGPYLSGYNLDIPRILQTSFAIAANPLYQEAIISIPAPTEIMGYCTDALGTGFVQTSVIPIGTSFLVLADVKVWPPVPVGSPVLPYPYPTKLSKGTAREEVVNIAVKYEFGVFPSTVEGLYDTATYSPGILELHTPTLVQHQAYDATTGIRGDFAILMVEQLLVADGTGFPTSDGYLLFDFGYKSQEVVEYSSRTSNVFIFNPEAEFEFQHPVKIPPYSYNLNPELFGVDISTIHACLKSYSYDTDGMDYPLYLPPDVLGLLAPGGGTSGSIIDYIRTAGTKVELISGGTKPVCDPR